MLKIVYATYLKLKTFLEKKITYPRTIPKKFQGQKVIQGTILFN